METKYDAVTEADKEEFVALIEDICSNLSATDVVTWKPSPRSWANHFYIESSNDEFIGLYLMNSGYATKAMQNRIKISSSCPDYLRDFVRSTNSPKDVTVTETASANKIADTIVKKFLPEYRKSFAHWNLHYSRTMVAVGGATKRAAELSKCLDLEFSSDSPGSKESTSYTAYTYTADGSLKIRVTNSDVHVDGYISFENAKSLLTNLRVAAEERRNEKEARKTDD